MNTTHSQNDSSRRAFCLSLAGIVGLGAAALETAARARPVKPVAPVPPTPEMLAAHCEWLTQCITKIGALKVGMTRQDVAKVLQSEYGFYPRDWQRFVFPDCRAIKVDTHFQPGPGESPDDKILSISKPVLDLSPVPL